MRLLSEARCPHLPDWLRLTQASLTDSASLVAACFAIRLLVCINRVQKPPLAHSLVVTRRQLQSDLVVPVPVCERRLCAVLCGPADGPDGGRHFG